MKEEDNDLYCALGRHARRPPPPSIMAAIISSRCRACRRDLVRLGATSWAAVRARPPGRLACWTRRARHRTLLFRHASPRLPHLSRGLRSVRPVGAAATPWDRSVAVPWPKPPREYESCAETSGLAAFAALAAIRLHVLLRLLPGGRRPLA